MAKAISKPKLQRHHIVYKPEITVGIRGDAHRVLNTIQRTRGSIDQLEWLKDFMCSIAYEVIRMTGEVQNGIDLRQEKFKRGRKAKPKREDY
jgi:hypothetical protein